MTISSSTNKSGPFDGNGVTTAFPGGFKIDDEAHVQVISTSALGVESTKVLLTDYTVSGVGVDTGFTINMLAAPASGVAITLILDVPFTQELDLVNQGAYNAEDVEASFDLAVQRDLQLQEQINRAVTLPASADAGDLDVLVANINSLGAVSAAVSTVAAIAPAVSAVAAIEADVSDVASISADVVAAAAAAPALIAAPGVAAGIAANVLLIDADRATMAADKALVAADKATVAADKGIVAADKALVAADKAATNANVLLTAADVIAAEAARAAAVVAKTAAEAASASTTPVQDQIDAATNVAFADADFLVARRATNGLLAKWSMSGFKTGLAAIFVSISNLATAAQFRSAEAGKVLTADVALSAMNAVSLTYAATITINHNDGVFRAVTLTGNPTFAAPTNLKDGWPLTLRITQDGTGSRAPAWNAAFDMGELGTPELSTGAGKVDYLFFMADAGRGKLRFTGISKDAS